ncbi:hypothetical protein FHS43_006635 [Streptosporangium becharense]|uniref:Uncharacterized protein n=1 Tax=Streptosporangium becharense TaxID=1816182 RepID=A0A7W9MDK7_9ACTN|nr:hypothetical protein [Streptosporangium becharense]MBB2915315.1 hypothetical protein [Streptosporangium becharense]MBB5816987.1 hypothetical protein [Streptosporangium becharense]
MSAPVVAPGTLGRTAVLSRRHAFPSRPSPGPRARGALATAAALLAVVVLPGCAADSRPAPSPSPRAHGLVIPPPREAGSFVLDEDGMWPFIEREEMMRNRPLIDELPGNIPVHDAVNARYRETPESRGGKWTRNMIFYGYTMQIGSDRWRLAVDHIIKKLLKGKDPTRRFDVPLRSSAGHATCIGLKGPGAGSEEGICVWADEGTVGVMNSTSIGTAELGTALPAFHAAVRR